MGQEFGKMTEVGGIDTFTREAMGRGSDLGKSRMSQVLGGISWRPGVVEGDRVRTEGPIPSWLS